MCRICYLVRRCLNRLLNTGFMVLCSTEQDQSQPFPMVPSGQRPLSRLFWCTYPFVPFVQGLSMARFEILRGRLAGE